eukprot:8450210-Pyramimonas_sp.AAC.1
MRYEHLRVLLEEEDTWDLSTIMAQSYTPAELPDDIAAALRLGRLTTLKKDNGRVRGIVAGSIIRRVVCKAVAKQFNDKLNMQPLRTGSRCKQKLVRKPWPIYYDMQPIPTTKW